MPYLRTTPDDQILEISTGWLCVCPQPVWITGVMPLRGVLHHVTSCKLCARWPVDWEQLLEEVMVWEDDENDDPPWDMLYNDQ